MAQKPMNIKERLEFIESNYDFIAAGFCFDDKEEIIPAGAIKKCRFCEKDETETTFNNKAHAIPECLGNHKLILAEECDPCNKFFSDTLEAHLDRYTRPFRIIGQIEGKRGVPNYQSNNQKSKIKHGEIPTYISPAEEKFFTFDFENKTATVNLHREPYIPFDVYRAFVKIAISTIAKKNELPAFAKTIEWLMSSSQTMLFGNPAKISQVYIPGPRPTNGIAYNFLRRKPSCKTAPYAMFLIAFGNYAIQFIVPSIFDETVQTNEMVLFPTPFELSDWPYGHPETSTIDLSSTEKRKEDFSVPFRYDEILAVPPESIDPKLYSK